jgi:hypothetical protein
MGAREDNIRDGKLDDKEITNNVFYSLATRNYCEEITALRIKHQLYSSSGYVLTTASAIHISKH